MRPGSALIASWTCPPPPGATPLAFFSPPPTGLTMPPPRLSVLVSRRQTVQYIHFWGGVAWLGALAAVIVLGGRRMLATAREPDTLDRDDLRWLRGGKAPQGRVNAGPKNNAVLTAAVAGPVGGSRPLPRV